MVQETNRKRILFVDDDESIRLTLPRIFAGHGFEVTSVASMEDALTEIQAEKFDALLSDLNVSDINDGFVVIEKMRKVQPGCIVFILTGNPAQESFQRAAGQVARYFIKPVDIEEMVSAIKQKLTPRHSPATMPDTPRDPKLKYPWQQAVLDAFTEGRPERLPAKINAAERAIAARLCDPTDTDLDEHAALQAALRSLRILFPATEHNEECGEKKEIA